jgi:signal transduction histidine kinase/PAS domain-containing protein
MQHEDPRSQEADLAAAPPVARPSPQTGEMGHRIAEFSWQQTPLGSSERWPRSLHSIIRILLGSRYPMILLWGPDLVQLYNDAYIGLIGAKHPDALGRPIRDTQAESWDAIGPMIREVMSTGIPNWVPAQQLPLMRAGYLEESYFSLSYSAVDDDDGVIRGMLCVCSEVTEQIVSARRMKLLRELAAAGEAKSWQATCEHLGLIIGEHALDVPFAALYTRASDGDALELCSSANIGPGHAFPPRVELGNGSHPLWPFARVAAGETVLVEDVHRHIDCRGGPFRDTVRAAYLMPLGSADPGASLGLLVAAVSPARGLDDSYRTFYELLGGQVSMLLRNTHAFEQERKRVEALAEIDRVKTAFFSNVSHEFRTPLTLILGPLENALAGPARSLGGDDLETVHRNALRLLRLVNSLLDFSRIEAGRLGARFEPTDVAILTAGLAGSFQSLLESSGLKLVVDCPPLPEPVYVDRSHWEKIVLNLLSNAFKFTFEGEIAVSLRADGDRVELAVRDTGIGISAEEQSHIFERFHRIEGTPGRSFEGSGIGLALVQELTKQHQGSLRVESVPGKGSTFLVSIPLGKKHLAEDCITAASPLVAGRSAATPYLLDASHWNEGPLAAGAEHSAGPAGAEPSPPASRARVLIADDNADMREYLIRLLAPRWRVHAVPDGQAALEAALVEPPDLVLSDVMMPRMDGVALLRALRADPRTSTIPVVLLSARAGEEAIIGGLETGANDYLVKPFSARELISRVGTHLEMARIRRVSTDTANELAETRATLLEDVERKNRELEAFSYSVSHDLRAPLRTIDGFSQALLDDCRELGEIGQGYLQRVRSAAQRMGELIDDLLKLAGVGRAELHRESADLTRLGQRIGEQLGSSNPDRNVSFVVHEGLAAHADRRLVQVLLENLLGNAWKFTARTPSPRVELGAIQEGGVSVFYVKDNGAGFDDSYVGRLFNPFQRLHSELDFPGTGVGLATVRRVVERHGGRVWAEGRVNEGATIYWTLPARGRSPST